MNLFDTPLNLEDENLLLSVKSLDQEGFQKWVNLIDAGRALIFIARTNWYYGFKTSPMSDELGNPVDLKVSVDASNSSDNSRTVDSSKDTETSNPSENPGNPHSDGICLFQDALDSFRIFTDLEPWEVTTQHIAYTLEPFQALRAWLEAVIEYSVNTATTFPTKVEFARQTLPPVIAAMESLSAIYEEAAKNTLSALDLEARQVLKRDSKISKISRNVESLAKSNTSNTSKASKASTVRDDLEDSGKSDTSNNPRDAESLDSPKSPASKSTQVYGFPEYPSSVPTVDFEDGSICLETGEYIGNPINSGYPRGLDTENTHFFRMLEVLSRYQRMMETEPSTAKALMGKNLMELLQAASLFFNSRGQSLQKELKAAKLW